MTRFDGCYPFPVKAREQIGEGIPRATPGGFGRCGVAFTIGHGQKCFGPSEVGSGLGVRAADANEQLAFSSWVSGLRGSFWRRVMGTLLLCEVDRGARSLVV